MKEITENRAVTFNHVFTKTDANTQTQRFLTKKKKICSSICCLLNIPSALTRLFADGGCDAYFGTLSSNHLQHQCISVSIHRPGVKTQPTWITPVTHLHPDRVRPVWGLQYVLWTQRHFQSWIWFCLPSFPLCYSSLCHHKRVGDLEELQCSPWE